jgi:menaquinone-9 beta-reductase
MNDVVIAGGGPAGALSALLLARAGARVRLFDRATFPRDKLCGDTINPGALAILARHLDVTALVAQSLPVTGMRLTGPGGVALEGRYAEGLAGRAITRRVLDAWLVGQAVSAGAQLEEGVVVTSPILKDGTVDTVRGVRVRGRRGAMRSHEAHLTIAADGRRSQLAAAFGLAAAPHWPRRWAVGGYFEGVRGLGAGGEMHVRVGHYIGVAPVPGGLTNACLVAPHQPGDRAWRDPAALLASTIASDPMLAPRFAGARLVTPAVMLGPMAVDARGAGVPGLLLAGDAAGFIDPITGDGIRFALRGAEIAARAALDVLAGRLSTEEAPAALLAARRTAFAGKWRFNRLLRRLVAWPHGLTAAAMVARLAPAAFTPVIRYAGDTRSERVRQASGT